MIENRFEHTICAQASASGPGAVSIIRLSGANSLTILDNIFRPASGSSGMASRPGYKMVYGTLFDPACGDTVDEVLVSVFHAPHSYTGEESAEIYCHGSDYIVSCILRLLIAAGARMAAPGEFTQRAFLNGKLDLAQAEAVADLIASESKAAHDVALQQLKGGFSSELKQMRSELVDIVALMELELDFSEEDVEFADRTRLRSLVDAVQSHIRSLTDSFAYGNAIKNGVPVAIVGATNTGKSTLLNAILGEERAIVSDIAGTTRDTIEDTVVLNGIRFRFIDTAGIRETSETIEQIGISRSWQKMKEASVVLLVLDGGHPETFRASISDMLSHLTESPRARQTVVLINKSDIVENADALIENVKSLTSDNVAKCDVMAVSAKNRSGLEQLSALIAEGQKSLKTSTGSATTVTNLRHYEALVSAQEALTRVRTGLDTTLSTELIAEDIRMALYHIGTITGEVTPDEILGTVFGRFCIGK